MGTWGVKLYQDDLAEDIKNVYTDQLKRGKTGNQVTQELIEQYRDVISDSDEASVFWFSLADTQWNLGRLENEVKENAIHYIDAGWDLKRWEENSTQAQKREKILNELKEKLLSPQPAEKKIGLYKLYQCEWEIGDVYAYPLESEYAGEKGIAGRYFLLHKIGETTYWPGHTIPIVRVKMSDGKQLPKSAAEFEKLEYVQTALDVVDTLNDQLRGRCLVNGKSIDGYELDEFGFLPNYRLKLINTSKRSIPKNLIYVGCYKNVCPPVLEFVPEDISIPGFMWKFWDKIMVERYCGYNLRQYEIYAKKD